MGSILSHEEYLYSHWRPNKAVNLVIETLFGEALYGEWDYKGNMAACLRMTKSCLERKFGVQYFDEEILECVELLHERFTVWKGLMADPEVMINKRSKKVSVKPKVWERLIMDDEHVKWYGNEGEKAYDDLEVIFENPWKGKMDFVFLGDVSGLHNIPSRLDQVELSPLPVAPMPPKGRTYIDGESPVRPLATIVNNNKTFSPIPQGTPGLRIISKDDYEKLLSANNSKHKKRLFVVPDSLISSVGSSTNPIESSFSRLRTKFDKNG